jgi:hypothetical protein
MLLISTLYIGCFGIYIVSVNMCELCPPIWLVSCYSARLSAFKVCRDTFLSWGDVYYCRASISLSSESLCNLSLIGISAVVFYMQPGGL